MHRGDKKAALAIIGKIDPWPTWRLFGSQLFGQMKGFMSAD